VRGWRRASRASSRCRGRPSGRELGLVGRDQRESFVDRCESTVALRTGLAMWVLQPASNALRMSSPWVETVPLAFCAAFAFCMAAYFYTQRADCIAGWNATDHGALATHNAGCSPAWA